MGQEDVTRGQHHVDEVQQQRQGAAAARAQAAEDAGCDQREDQVDGDAQRDDQLQQVDKADDAGVGLHAPEVGTRHPAVTPGDLDAAAEMQQQHDAEQDDEQAADDDRARDGVGQRRHVR